MTGGRSHTKKQKELKYNISNPTQSRVGFEYGDGFSHGLEPLRSLDLSKVNSFSDMLNAMSKTSFGGRKTGEAAEVLYDMTVDKNCFVVLTLSGAMTIAKMGLVICDMIEKGLVHAIVSTGALMAHGFVEATGLKHFKYDPQMNDKELYYKGYDRVYDTLEPEKNLDHVEEIMEEVLNTLDEDEVLCSRKLHLVIGRYLSENCKGRGVLKSAYEKGVPVYVPAFSDSELGLDFALFNRKRIREGKKPIRFDPFLDLEHFANTIFRQEKLGIFTVGGGVPRNWAQQVGPYLDIVRYRIHDKDKNDNYLVGAKNLFFKRFHYGIRICPEPTHWGGLSGCTYSEGVSWGKFIPVNEGGKYAEVPSDATIVWPLIVKGVLERLDRHKIKIKKTFEYAEDGEIIPPSLMKGVKK